MTDPFEITLPRETALQVAERARHSFKCYYFKKDLDLAEWIENTDPSEDEVVFPHERWYWAHAVVSMLWTNERREEDRQLLIALDPAPPRPSEPLKTSGPSGP